MPLLLGEILIFLLRIHPIAKTVLVAGVLEITLFIEEGNEVGLP